MTSSNEHQPTRRPCTARPRVMMRKPSGRSSIADLPGRSMGAMPWGKHPSTGRCSADARTLCARFSSLEPMRILWTALVFPRCGLLKTTSVYKRLPRF